MPSDPDILAIRARGLTLTLGSASAPVEILKGIDLDIAQGEVVALLGPSGSGKSSLMAVLSGLERASGGSLTVAGQDFSHLDEDGLAAARRGRIGIVLQAFHLLPTMTAAENVATPMELAGSKDASERAVAELRAVGLGHRTDHYPTQLSGGEQQRVALARALAPKPRIMLMDEPFSGLDDRLRDDIRDETLAVLKDEGTAVLLVTHEPGEAMRMADQIALMRDGRIVQQGAPYNIYNAPVDLQAAGFFSDINVIRGKVQGALTETPFGQFLAPGVPDGTEVDIVIRPQHIKIDFDRGGRGPNPTPEDGTAARGVVERARFMGASSLVEFRMDYDGSILKAVVPSVFLPKPDLPLWLMIRRERCFVFPRGGKARS